ncbi:hypothetical protein Btru_027645 [Bulinus truncatus]|nr:hypothetical protein Btru_027645 [Bulinus truncatus]
MHNVFFYWTFCFFSLKQVNVELFNKQLYFCICAFFCIFSPLSNFLSRSNTGKPHFLFFSCYIKVKLFCFGGFIFGGEVGQESCITKLYASTAGGNASCVILFKPSKIDSEMPKNTIEQWESLFKAADKDKSGTLDVFELRDMLRRGNSNMTDSQIADAFVFFDGPKGDRKITLEEFVKGMNRLEDFLAKLAALFKKYDADNSGYLDKNELRKILEASGHKFTEQEINEILKNADKSGDGKISFEEFMDACA